MSSSNIASVSYDGQRRILEVEFLNGSIYQYSFIPESLFQGLMSASSHGAILTLTLRKLVAATKKSFKKGTPVPNIGGVYGHHTAACPVI
ncbi:MAG: KTSC domain-containing protein [Abitibacteriaceae bacterium]|nr:KTSC domain-containing protein [Abditibacteriaceae bacterium]